MARGSVADVLKLITDRWAHELGVYAKLPNNPQTRKHKFMARRTMLTKKIVTLRDHDLALTRQWLQENSS